VDLYAFQFDLIFNPSVLEAVSVTEGSFLRHQGPTVFVPGTISNSAGRISLTAGSLIGPIAGASGDGPLAGITFTALANGTSNIRIGNPVLLDSTLAPVTASLEAGVVQVGIPEPSTFYILWGGLAGLLTLGVVRSIKTKVRLSKLL